MPQTSALSIGFKVKKLFIRDKPLMSEFEKSRNAALRRFGTFVRQDARKSIKPGKKGQESTSGPPKSWTKSEPNLRTILYGLENNFLDLTVVIGPVAFSPRRPTVPEKLEHGIGGYRQHAFMGPSLQRKYHLLMDSLLKFGVV